jgi:hypothetical protein
VSFDRVEKARGGRGNADSEPLLAIYPNATARFNKAACDEWLDGVGVVEFYVDFEAERLGIARGGDPGSAWTLTADEPGYSASFRRVLSEIGIHPDDLSETRYLPLEHDPAEGLLVADAAPLFAEVDE